MTTLRQILLFFDVAQWWKRVADLHPQEVSFYVLIDTTQQINFVLHQIQLRSFFELVINFNYAGVGYVALNFQGSWLLRWRRNRSQFKNARTVGEDGCVERLGVFSFLWLDVVKVRWGKAARTCTASIGYFVPCSSFPNLLRFRGSVASRYSNSSHSAWTTCILVHISLTLWAGSMLPRLLGAAVQNNQYWLLSLTNWCRSCRIVDRVASINTI